MYTEEQIRNAGKEGEINYHEVEHIIATLNRLFGKKEPISEDDIENLAEEIYSKGTPFSIRGGKDWMIYKINDAIKTGYVLAQQHTNSKLEEIEKWCDEVNGYDYFNTEQSAEAFAEGVKEVKSKIQSLKAE